MRYEYVLGMIGMMLIIAGCGGETDAPNQPDDQGRPQTAVPTCFDSIQNQGETAIDCGGPCPACPSCTDGVMNQGETGIDCGGPCKACESCADGMMNQGETGIDCGGPCPACPPIQAEASYEVSAEDKAALQQKLEGITISALAKTTAMNLKPGDSFVFALGVKNLKTYPSKFRMSVVFERARDTKSNPIAVNDRDFDQSYIMQWLGKNDFTKVYELEPNAAAVMPIIVVVQDLYGAGKPTIPGSYYFKAKVEYYDELQYWDDYTEKDFAVNII